MAAPRPTRVPDSRDRAIPIEFITDEDILPKVRAEGLEDLARVKRVYLKADGPLTVIKRQASGA